MNVTISTTEGCIVRRYTIAALSLVLFVAPAAALANGDTPEEAEAGCQGIAPAEDAVEGNDTADDAAGPVLDDVEVLLTGDEDGCEGTEPGDIANDPPDGGGQPDGTPDGGGQPS